MDDLYSFVESDPSHGCGGRFAIGLRSTLNTACLNIPAASSAGDIAQHTAQDVAYEAVQSYVF